MELLKKIGRALKNFGTEVVRSAYDLTWYREVRQSHAFGRSFRYLLLLELVVVTLYAGALLVALVPLPKIIVSELTARVPDGAYVEIKDDVFSTNLPDGWEIKEPNFNLVIDGSYTGLEVPEHAGSTWMFVGQDGIFVRDDRGDRTVPLKDFDDVRFTKTEAIAWVQDHLLSVILLFGLLGYVAGLAGFTLFNMLFVAVASLAAAGLARLLKLRISFERWWVMGLRMLTLPILVTVLLWWAGVTVPAGFSVLYLLLIVAIVIDERNNPLDASGPESAAGSPAGPSDQTKPPAS